MSRAGALARWVFVWPEGTRRASCLASAGCLLMLFCASRAGAHHLGEPAGFEEALTRAERAFNRGRYAQAAADFAAAEGLAVREDNRVDARLRKAQAFRRMGRAAEARDALFFLARRWPRHEKAPRALYVAARIRETELRDARGGESEHLALLRKYPRSDAAGRSLLRVAHHRATASVADALEFLRDTYRHNKRRPLGPRALYEGARMFEERLRSPGDAVRLYELLARRYPKNGLRDDALWHAARIHREARRPVRAIKLLRRLLATKRESWALGSYNSVHLDKAGLLVGEIEERDLRDDASAVRSYRAFIDEFPHSFLRVRARRLYVETLARLGRIDVARRALEELARAHPQSRETRLAREALDRARPKP